MLQPVRPTHQTFPPRDEALSEGDGMDFLALPRPVVAVLELLQRGR